jgi:hypothetical protein
MPEIILTEEQATVLASATGPVAVKDRDGNLLGRLEPALTPAEIAELKRRAASPGPWFTGKQVQARLEALQAEWDATGGFDESRLKELLRSLDAADPGHMRATEDRA